MTSDGKQLFREVVEEVWHRGNLAHIRDAFHPAFVGNRPGHRLQDLGAYRRYVTGTRAAFPDVRIDVHQQIGEGDLVASRYVVRGTHYGEFFGVPATGRRIAVEGMTFHRFSGDRIAESWGCWDALGLLTAIGKPFDLRNTA